MEEHAALKALLVAALLPLVSCSLAPLRLGAGINLFSRYGYLSISMRVVPRNDSNNSWIFREPSVDVFRNDTLRPVPLVFDSMRRRGGMPVFTGEFHLELCDNVRQLTQAYFRDFHVEGLERAWRAFTGSWTRTNLGRYLGIESRFLSDKYRFVLVRLARFRHGARISSPALLPLDAVRSETDSVHRDDVASVATFLRSFGSHYVNSFVTGNSLYQVFVYDLPAYTTIKKKLKDDGAERPTSEELNAYFSPWYAEHVGTILSASGNTTVQKWASEHLKSWFYYMQYASLLKAHGNSETLEKLDKILENEAILQLDLKTLTPLFLEQDKREWFREVLDNFLRLWEVNM